MFHEISVDGYRLLPVLGDAALIASKTQPGAWHAVKLDRCDCDGFNNRGTCRHIRALASYLSPDEALPIDDGEYRSFGEWQAQRALAARLAILIRDEEHRAEFLAGYETERAKRITLEARARGRS